MEGHVGDREHHPQRLRGTDTGGMEDRRAQVGGQEWWPPAQREEVRALQERHRALSSRLWGATDSRGAVTSSHLSCLSVLRVETDVFSGKALELHVFYRFQEREASWCSDPGAQALRPLDTGRGWAGPGLPVPTHPEEPAPTLVYPASPPPLAGEPLPV